MQCPNCKLFNPDSTLRCDCGFDFSDRQMRSSLLSATEQQRRAPDESGLEPFEAGILRGGLPAGIAACVVGAAWFVAGLSTGRFYVYLPILIVLGGVTCAAAWRKRR